MWRHLVCARCNAVVAEGRCASCRRVRDSSSPSRELLAAAVGALLVALVTLLVLLGEPVLGTG